MDFFQNLNVRIKLFSGIFLIILVFLVLMFWQFSTLDKIDDNLTLLNNTERSLNSINELSEINKKEMALLLEIIQIEKKEELKDLKKIYEDHSFTTKKIHPLYDSLFNDVKIIFPKKSSANRIKIVDFLSTSQRTINDALIPYFDNVNSIKKEQIEEGDIFLIEQLIEQSSSNEDDSTASEDIAVIVPNDDGITVGSSRGVQLRGLYGKYKQNYLDVSDQYSQISKILRDEFLNSKAIAGELTQNIKWRNSLFFLIAIIVALIVLALVKRTISKPLTELQNLALKLAEGELPEHSEIQANDEIGKMATALNALTDGLIKTSEFASEIGRSNFTSKFEPLSNKDVLGNSLLEMRKSLQAANEEENKRKIEDKERNWTTEGMAKFGEILRRHTENIGLLSKDIIQNLIKYLNANQGGIFILNDSDPGDVHLELMSAYAYNREKFIKKRIQLGQGLVGGAAVEKYTVHLTELPEEYIEIESGLGGANPNSLLIVPLKLEDIVLGVIEIASFNQFKNYEIELVERIGESIASTLSTAKINTTTAELLEQSRIQTQEMQEQDEEMRQNMEEMIAAQEDSLRREEELKKEVEELEAMRINFVEKDKKQRRRIEELTREYKTTSDELELLFSQVNRAFEANLEPVILIDETSKIQFFNHSAEILTEYNRTEILGRGLEAIFDEETRKSLSEDITLYFQTARKGLIDKQRYIDITNRAGEKVPIIMTMLDVIIRGKRTIAIFVKNLGTANKLEEERDRIKETLMSKEFDYTTKINILESFIHDNKLQIPIDLESQSDLITWTNKYSIGLNIIDQQHKKWIDFINMLYRSYKAKAKKKDISEHISKLLDYTDYHFGFEEKYLEDFNCGNLEAHKSGHGEFVTNIKKFQKKHNDGDQEAVYKLIIYLNNWILNHIQNDDKRYVECFKLNGLS